MAQLWSLYTSTLHKQLRYRGTWLPSTAIELGTVGVFRKGVLDPVTTLERLEIPYETSCDAVPDGSLDFRSKGSVGVTLKAAGATNQAFSVLAGADAGMLVTFSRGGGVLLQLRGVTVDRIADKHGLATDLLDAVLSPDDAMRWKREWVVVTDVVNAETATVLVSEEEGGRLELRASGKVGPLSLADADAAFTVADEKGVGVRLIAAARLTPLYNGLRVKKHFWSLYDQVLPAGSSLEGDAERVFGDLDPSEDVDSAND